MPPTSALNATGQVFEHQFKHAFNLFRADRYDEANDLCLWLIQQPELGNYHSAGCHLILAHSPDEYVEHATIALRLYREMQVPSKVSHESSPADRCTRYTDPEHPPTRKQRESKETLVKSAEGVLQKALADAEEYGANEPLDMAALDEEIQTAMEQMYFQEEELEKQEVGMAMTETDVGDAMEGVELLGEDDEAEVLAETTGPLLPIPRPSRGNQ